MLNSKYVLIWGLIVLMAITSGICYCIANVGDECTASPSDNQDEAKESTQEYWNQRAQDKLIEQLNKKKNLNRAKNIILFLGDGMSISTITAARILQGQKMGQTGEEAKIVFEDFPYLGLAKTYCVDKQVADSACSSSAYLSGVKANYGTIGVNARVRINDCDASNRVENHLTPITKLALDAGKRIGVVTTMRVTDASPAGTYAHVSSRNFECDNDTIAENQNPAECPDIATQMIRDHPGKDFHVILGGGRSKFLPFEIKDDNGFVGERQDGIDLITEWKKSKKHRKSKFIFDKEGLNSLKQSNPDYVLGLFHDRQLPYNLDVVDEKNKVSLAEMTEASIRILSKEKNGYFLFVEGALIDTAHHLNLAQKALDETVEFAKAVDTALEMVNLNETLIVITADHAHTMTIAGYSTRGKSVMSVNTEKDDVEGLPYTTISYANGPGFVNSNGAARTKLLEENFINKDFAYPATIPYTFETHGGEDVAVYATGPWSHLFDGTYEQNVIPHMMAYSACLGDGLTCCDEYHYFQ